MRCSSCRKDGWKKERALLGCVQGESELSSCVIGAAIEVHRHLGPGLLESVYRLCLVEELRARGRQIETEVPLAVSYRELRIECGYRIDIVVDRSLIVELKAVKTLEPVNTAQLLTYLRLSNIRIGLLINFNVSMLKNGVRRVVI